MRAGCLACLRGVLVVAALAVCRTAVAIISRYRIARAIAMSTSGVSMCGAAICITARNRVSGTIVVPTSGVVSRIIAQAAFTGELGVFASVGSSVV